MSGDCDEEALLSLLEDEYAREVLTAASLKPMSADSLAERCDASESTIYRRVNRLEQHDLIEQRTQIDPEGNHYSVYATRLERVTVEFEDGERTVEIDRAEPETEDTADRFTRMWQDL